VSRVGITRKARKVTWVGRFRWVKRAIIMRNVKRIIILRRVRRVQSVRRLKRVRRVKNSEKWEKNE
jgi:hypothetical protein